MATHTATPTPIVAAAAPLATVAVAAITTATATATAHPTATAQRSARRIVVTATAITTATAHGIVTPIATATPIDTAITLAPETSFSASGSSARWPCGIGWGAGQGAGQGMWQGTGQGMWQGAGQGIGQGTGQGAGWGAGQGGSQPKATGRETVKPKATGRGIVKPKATGRGTVKFKVAWTREEDEIIVQNCLREEKWVRIAEQLPGRSGDAVRNHYKRLAATSGAGGGPVTSEGLEAGEQRKKGNMWSPEEDAIITAGVSMHGHKWAPIAAMLPGRSANAVRNRSLRI